MQKSFDSDFVKFVERTKIYLDTLLKNIYWIVLASGITAGISLYLATKQGKFYQCKLTFVLDEENAGNSLDFASITGMYGLTNQSESGASSDRIMELFRSNKFLTEELLRTDSTTSKSLANRVLDNYNKGKFFSQLGFIDNWNEHEKKEIKQLEDNFQFKSNNYAELTRVEKSVLLNIIDFLTQKKEPVTRISFNEDSGIFTLLTRSKNHDLSIDLTNALYIALSKYYISNKLKKYEEIYQINKIKTDSLRQAMASVQYQLADFEDSNRNLVFSKGKLKQKRLNAELQVVQVLYSEARKQLQISEYSLRQVKPIFQIIDYPAESLMASRQSKKRAVLRGGILGAFAIIGFFLLKKVWELATSKAE